MYMLYAIHKSSQSEIFFKIGVPKKYAKFLKNTSEQVHFLVELYAQSLNSSLVFSKNLASILNSWTALYFKEQVKVADKLKEAIQVKQKNHLRQQLAACVLLRQQLAACVLL